MKTRFPTAEIVNNVFGGRDAPTALFEEITTMVFARSAYSLSRTMVGSSAQNNPIIALLRVSAAHLTACSPIPFFELTEETQKSVAALSCYNHKIETKQCAGTIEVAFTNTDPKNTDMNEFCQHIAPLMRRLEPVFLLLGYVISPCIEKDARKVTWYVKKNMESVTRLSTSQLRSKINRKVSLFNAMVDCTKSPLSTTECLFSIISGRELRLSQHAKRVRVAAQLFGLNTKRLSVSHTQGDKTFIKGATFDLFRLKRFLDFINVEYQHKKDIDGLEPQQLAIIQPYSKEITEALVENPHLFPETTTMKGLDKLVETTERMNAYDEKIDAARKELEALIDERNDYLCKVHTPVVDSVSNEFNFKLLDY